MFSGLLFIFVLFFSFLTITLYWMREGTKHHKPTVDFGELQRLPVKQFNASVAEIFRSWFSLVSTAQHSVDMMTYRWRTSEKNTHIRVLGEAFKTLGKNLLKTKETVQVRIIVNQLYWSEKTSQIQAWIDETFQIWRQMGVNFELVQVQFFAWKHFLTDNIHAKFLIVDRVKYSIHSCNVESYSHGCNGSWVEAGIEIHDPPSAQALTGFFNRHVNNNWHVRKIHASPPPTRSGVPEMLVTNPLVEKICHSYPVSDEEDKNMHDPNSSGYLIGKTVYNPGTVRQSLATLLRNAQKSIHILTPNFNDDLLWKSLFESSCTEKRVMWGNEFNVDVPWIQENLLGWSNNHQIWARIAKETQSANLEVKWYGDPQGKLVQGKVEHVVHAKLMIIDDFITVVGSINLDLYSTVASVELGVVVESWPIAQQANEMFSRLWTKGIPCQ